MNHPYMATSPNLTMALYFQKMDQAHAFAQAQAASLPGEHRVYWQNPSDPDDWAVTAVYEGGLLIWSRSGDVPIAELGS